MAAEIHHGDALEIVGELGEFDYLITDPPYPPGGNSMNDQIGEKTKGTIGDARIMADAMSQTLVCAVFRAVRRKHPFSAWIFGDFRQIAFYNYIFTRMGYGKTECIIWDKRFGGRGGSYKRQHEQILYVSDKTYNSWTNDVVRQDRPPIKGKTHIYEKPPELVEQMCRRFPAGRVIDPFCGTGGLLVGAGRLGWECVGVDLETRFCETARRRLDEETRQMTMGVDDDL